MPSKTPPTGAEIVADAMRYLGIRYVLGGGPNNPQAGLDCSGLVERVCFDLGIMSCPRTTYTQYTWGIPVNQPSAGDLVFFTGSDAEHLVQGGRQVTLPGHVGIVVSPGQMIQAPHTGTTVQISSYSTNGSGFDQFMGYRKIPGATASGTANQNYSTTSDQQGNALVGIFGGLFEVFGFAILFLVIIAAIILFGYILMKAGG
jgi:cell wall-associated NlpC family hydrolase